MKYNRCNSNNLININIPAKNGGEKGVYKFLFSRICGLKLAAAVCPLYEMSQS